MNERIFIKMGGSFITDKTTPDSLDVPKIRKIAQAIFQAKEEKGMELVLAHGAGSYGHIKAQQFQAQEGIRPQHGWQAFYHIRQDMIGMNLRVVRIFKEEGLNPITIQPSAIIMASHGAIRSIHTDVIGRLLTFHQIPLLHGDIVIDEAQGFTIASTEDILAALSKTLFFQRVIMISDVPGVLDRQGRLIPVINQKNHADVITQLSGSKGIDVTGGMKDKVQQLFSLIQTNNIGAAYILSGNEDGEAIKNVIMGMFGVGTMVTR